jgi:hypothetical protein
MKHLFVRLAILTVVIIAYLPVDAAAEKYAFVVGISGYLNYEPGQRLQYTDDDATMFAAFLQSAEGGAFAKHNIRLLTNEQATRAKIFSDLSWLSNRVSLGDTVYVFFAGHGQPDTDNRVFFMPFDADPKQPEVLGIRADEFLRMVRERINARDLFLFIDACYSGAVYERDGAARATGVNVSAEIGARWKEAFNAREAKGAHATFLSAAPNQRSWEDPELQHGLFTYYLVDGLRGDADRDKNSIVTVSELRRYVVDKVEQHAERRKYGSQTPQVVGGYDPNFPLAVSASGNQRPGVPTVASGKFVQLQLDPIANYPLDWLTQPPTGALRLGGIPFDFVRGPNATFATRTHFSQTLPITGSINLSVPRPIAVHLIVSGAWVVQIAIGEQIGEIRLNFDTGEIIAVPIINGHNIRETWEYERALSVSASQDVGGSRRRGVWQEEQLRGSDPVADRARAYLDMLSIEIPARLQGAVLRGIDIVDANRWYVSTDGKVKVDPSIVLAAATVEHR